MAGSVSAMQGGRAGGEAGGQAMGGGNDGGSGALASGNQGGPMEGDGAQGGAHPASSESVAESAEAATNGAASKRRGGDRATEGAPPKAARRAPVDDLFKTKTRALLSNGRDGGAFDMRSWQHDGLYYWGAEGAGGGKMYNGEELRDKLEATRRAALPTIYEDEKDFVETTPADGPMLDWDQGGLLVATRRVSTARGMLDMMDELQSLGMDELTAGGARGGSAQAASMAADIVRCAARMQGGGRWRRTGGGGMGGFQMWPRRRRVRWGREGEPKSRIYGSTAELADAWARDELEYDEVVDTDERDGRTVAAIIDDDYDYEGAETYLAVEAVEAGPWTLWEWLLIARETGRAEAMSVMAAGEARRTRRTGARRGTGSAGPAREWEKRRQQKRRLTPASGRSW